MKNPHRKNPYKLEEIDKRENNIAFYGSAVIAVLAIVMIVGGFV